MAEGETKLKDLNSDSEKSEKGDSLECAVCLQTCIHPAQLPCGHIFCFLCIKGIANQSKRCAMCRQEIPRDFLEQPNLLKAPAAVEVTETHEGGYQWFYEGRNGWWQYDERTSKELEASYKAGERTCELLIAGFLYVTDLEAMLQLRRNDPLRRRRIKRDLATIPKKGIAGLRTNNESEIVNADSIELQRPSCPVEGRTDNLTPVTPSNTPQTPSSGQESPTPDDLQATVDRIRSLRLDSNETRNRLRSSTQRENNDDETQTSNQNRRTRTRFNFGHRNVD